MSNDPQRHERKLQSSRASLPKASPGGQYVPDLDDNLAESQAVRKTRPVETANQDAPLPLSSPWSKVGKIPAILGGLVLAVVCGLALLNPNSTIDERASPSWTQHMAPLQARFEQSAAQEVKRVNRGGEHAFTKEMLIALSDRDTKTTGDVKAALTAQDLQKANTILQEAQQIPEVKQPLKTKDGAPIPVTKPELNEGLRLEILTGDTEFFHVYMFDCCAEDGDVVELIINGAPFATVPITNQGATLSIPVASGSPTTVNLRGIFDGGGGITVACRTSQGDFFMRPMMEGEEVSLAVVK